MRRFFSLLLMLILLLSGCGAADPGVTYPDPEPQKPWSLSREELPEGPQGQAYCAGFHVSAPEGAGSIKLILFRLENGAWEDVAGGSWTALPAGCRGGSFAVRFDGLWDTCEIQALSGEKSGALNAELDPEGKLSRLNTAVTFLKARTEAQWGELIPIAIQAASPQDRVYPPDPDLFRSPELADAQGYQEVYLLALSLQPASQEEP